MSRYLFPRWSNMLLPALLVIGAVMPLYSALVVAYGFSPKTLDVGYQPVQPVPYSHALHAGELGIDCRYCHNTVERSGFAAVPPTQTCMNCHTKIRPESPKLVKVKESFETGLPVDWVKVHKLGDYAYFNHSAHINRGVGCVTCHGRIDRMEVVYEKSPLSMGWCLNCHRNPVDNLRPVDHITDMAYDQLASLSPDQRQALRRLYLITEHNPSDPPAITQCSTCHR